MWLWIEAGAQRADACFSTQNVIPGKQAITSLAHMNKHSSQDLSPPQTDPSLTNIWISLRVPLGPPCMGLSSAKPLEQTDLSLEAGLYQAHQSSLAQRRLASFQFCSEHTREWNSTVTNAKCMNFAEVSALCLVLGEGGLASHMQYFGSCLEVTARMMPACKYKSHWMLVTDGFGQELLHLSVW